MSLFDELQWEVIKNPKSTYSALKIRQEQKESEEDEEKRLKDEWKELCAQKKQELSKEEYNKRRIKEWYNRNKERYAKKQLEKYHRDKAEEEEMIEEIYKSVYDKIPDPINRDKYYTQKYRDDDINYDEKFKFSWRASRLRRVKPSREEKYNSPIKIYNHWALNWMFTTLWNMQDKAYTLVKQYINEISLDNFCLSKKQGLTKNPMRSSSWKIRELVDGSDISKNQIYSVASAMLRDKYIVNELYMGRVSFLVGDVIITQAGNVLRPCLENNIPWITKDTVDELHKKRMDWLKKKTDDLKIYILQDAYLTKYKPNEYEQRFYLIPT